MKRRDRNKGALIVLIAVVLPVLLGGLGLVIDNGQAYDMKRRLQKAADAGALAAAHQLRRGDEEGYKTAALADAAANGAAAPHSEVVVYRPPITGPRAGNDNFVEVEVRRPASLFFMRALYEGDVDVEARATAGVLPRQVCVFALDEEASPGLTVGGNAIADLGDCSVYVNSDASRAARSMGGATLEAASIDVVGGYTGTGFTPPPTTGADVAEDPLADLPAPAVGACTHTDTVKVNTTATLDPGVYCGGIDVGSTGVVDFNPGIYILAGGGLNVNGGASVRGQGVMFYNTTGPYASGPIWINGSAIVDLHAPTEGTYASVLFFQDRDMPSKKPNQLAGTADSVYEGAVYMPQTPLIFIGTSDTKVQRLMIVAATVQFQGTTRFAALDPTNGLSPYTMRAALVY